jgi:hypothetical protein
MIYVYHTPFTEKFPAQCEWQKRFYPNNKGRPVWYMDRSTTNTGTGAGMNKYDSREEHTFSLGLHTTGFQAEMYAIKTRTAGNIKRGTHIGTPTLFPTVKQRSKPSAVSRQILNYSGTATNHW